MRALDEMTTGMLLHGSAGHALCCQKHTSIVSSSWSESRQERDRSPVSFKGGSDREGDDVCVLLTTSPRVCWMGARGTRRCRLEHTCDISLEL
jgi:hypothetical protein